MAVRYGAAACGHAATAAAAGELLEDGGNAIDAALAALCAACIAEPVLASLGGGGFALVVPAGGAPLLYDFFPETPERRRPEGEIDFRAIEADFGTTRQTFHIGLGAAAAPGMVRGLFALHRDHGRLPLTRIVEPAVRLAGDGIEVTEMAASLFQVVAPILVASPGARQIFAGAPDVATPFKVGDRLRWPALADVLDTLAREDDRLFYEGEIARSIHDACAQGGGHLTLADLAAYRVERRPPLAHRYRDWTVLTNPPPAAGGALVAFALTLLATESLAEQRFGAPAHVLSLVDALRQVDDARRAVERDEPVDYARLLDGELLLRYSAAVARAGVATRGTTHISTVDAEGMAVALTVSNGEGCGVMTADDAFMLNNVLGEEDLLPNGFQSWRPRTRPASMMAPTAAGHADGRVLVMGSGGSNRIRSAMTQVLVNLIDRRMPLDEAVEAPRLHCEGDGIDLEHGFGEDALAAARTRAEDARLWDHRSLFFGGVNAVACDARRNAIPHADSRRGGACWIR